MKDGPMNDAIITQPLSTNWLPVKKRVTEIRNQNTSRGLILG